MRNRIGAAIILGAFLALGIAAPASATASSCDLNIFKQSLIAGEEWNPPNGLASPGVLGIKSRVWVPGVNAFTNCDPDGEGNDGASAWVGIQPDSTNTGGNGGSIIQMGFTVCNDVTQIGVPDNPCNHNNNVRWFYAAAGCNGTLPIGFDLNLGVVPRQTWHDMQISWDPDTDKWDFKVDGSQIGTIDDDNSVVSCWLGNNRNSIKAVIAGEQFDHGDSLGNPDGGETKRLTFHDVEAKNAAGWFDLFNNSGSNGDCAVNNMPTGSPRYTCFNPYYPTSHQASGFPGSNIQITTDR